VGSDFLVYIEWSFFALLLTLFSNTFDFRCRRTLSAGTASISSSLRKHMLLRLLVAKILVKQSSTNIFPAGLSARAISAGVAAFLSNQKYSV
jgi:hypothetical protein